MAAYLIEVSGKENGRRFVDVGECKGRKANCLVAELLPLQSLELAHSPPLYMQSLITHMSTMLRPLAF